MPSPATKPPRPTAPPPATTKADNEQRLNRLRTRSTAPVRHEQEWQKTLVSIMETRDEGGKDDERVADKSRFTFDELWEVLVDHKYDDFEEYREPAAAAPKVNF